jgi:hypothetical protein
MSKVKLGLGAAAGLFAGSHFLFGNSETAKRNMKKLQGFAIKMKGEVVEKLEKAKQLSEPIYNQIVDDVSKKYKKIEAGQLNEVIADLKKQGKKILKDVKAEVGDLQAVATKKVNEVANKVVSKTNQGSKKVASKKVASKTPAKKPAIKTTSKIVVNKKNNSKTVVKTAKGKVNVGGKEMNMQAASEVTTANPAPGITETSASEVIVINSENN